VRSKIWNDIYRKYTPDASVSHATTQSTGQPEDKVDCLIHQETLTSQSTGHTEDERVRFILY